MKRLILAMGCVLLFSGQGWACSIPVFRYAIEKWAASKYELVIFHQGAISPENQVRIKKLREQGASANLLINLMDVSSTLEPNYKKLWEREGKDLVLPHCVLRYPEATDKTPHVWAGPLGSPKLNTIIESPVRQKVFDRLTIGDTAVVLLLLSGDAKSDQSAREFLAKQIPFIAKRIILPAQTMEGPQIKSVLPLDVRFTVVELTRDGPDAMLANMLLNSEDELPSVKGPIAFPVYGRGRALCSLHGEALEKIDDLQRALDYVCRACSCQVKELNPGVDLLIEGDWDEIFFAELGPAPRETGAAGTSPVTTETVEFGPPPRKVAEAPEPKVTTLPAPKTPLKPEYRTAPAAGYQTAEVRKPAKPAEEGTSTKTYLLIAAGCVVFLSCIWAWRSHQQNLQNLE